MRLRSAGSLEDLGRSRRFRRPIIGRVSSRVHFLRELTPASYKVECSSPDLTYPKLARRRVTGKFVSTQRSGLMNSSHGSSYRQ